MDKDLLTEYISQANKLLETVKQINSLISAHGGEAEVGEEERKHLILHITGVTHSPDSCVPCQRIITLLRQPRTVSKKRAERWAERLHCEFYIDCRRELYGILAELGVHVEEPKGGGEA